MIKRTVVSLLAALVALGVIVGVEILLAMRREYLPTEPALEIGGTFGPRDGKPLRFFVLGDSTAAGLGAPTADGAYAADLSRKLGRDGWRVHLTGVGVSGARVEGVLSEQLPMVEKEDPDLILIGIGANDVTHLTSLSDVERDMEEILRRSLATGARVVVTGVPDMRASAWYQPLRSLAGLRGRSVTGAIRRAARATGVPMVPLAERTAPYFAKDPDLYNSEDDFHPSAAGYARWADAIYPYLRQALQSDG